MNEPTRVQIPLAVYVSVFVCIGCKARVPGIVETAQIHRQGVNNFVNFIKDVPDNAYLAVQQSAPNGWQLINIPGRNRVYATDGYCCGDCAAIIQAVIDGALTTAQTAIAVSKLTTQGALTMEPLVQLIKPPPDPRQVVIPHEYTTTMENAPPNTVTCDICDLLENECRAKQAALISETKG